MAQFKREYEYVWAYTLSSLTKKVNDRLNDGWKIDGLISRIKEDSLKKFIQPMIKEVEIEVKDEYVVWYLFKGSAFANKMTVSATSRDEAIEMVEMMCLSEIEITMARLKQESDYSNEPEVVITKKDKKKYRVMYYYMYDVKKEAHSVTVDAVNKYAAKKEVSDTIGNSVAYSAEEI